MDPQKQFLVKVSFVGNFLFSENASSAILLALVLGYHFLGLLAGTSLGQQGGVVQYQQDFIIS